MKIILVTAILILSVIFTTSTVGAENKIADAGVNVTFVDRLNTTSFVHDVQFKPDHHERDVTTQKNSFLAWRGEAIVTVPWKNISRIDFIDGKSKYNCAVKLRDNRQILLRVGSVNSEYIGQNDFGGIFRIRSEYIRAIIFE